MDSVGGRALVIATVPGDLGEAATLLPAYEQLGVDVALVLPPHVRWQPPADPLGTVDYYRLLATLSDLPLMPYNTPGLGRDDVPAARRHPRHRGHQGSVRDDLPMFQAIQLLGERFVWIGNKRHDPGVAHLRYQMGMQGFTSGMTNFLPEPGAGPPRRLRRRRLAARRAPAGLGRGPGTCPQRVR